MMSYNCLLRWNPSKKEGKNRGQQRLGTSFQYLRLISIIISAKAYNQRHPMSVLKGIFIMLLTCIINGISHLKTTDGAGFAFSVLLEDQLKSHEEMDSQMRAWKPFKTLFCQNGATCQALIFFHKCLNSCRFSFPVPSVWIGASYGKIIFSFPLKLCNNRKCEYKFSFSVVHTDNSTAVFTKNLLIQLL